MDQQRSCHTGPCLKATCTSPYHLEVLPCCVKSNRPIGDPLRMCKQLSQGAKPNRLNAGEQSQALRLVACSSHCVHECAPDTSTADGLLAGSWSSKINPLVWISLETPCFYIFLPIGIRNKQSLYSLSSIAFLPVADTAHCNVAGVGFIFSRIR